VGVVVVVVVMGVVVMSLVVVVMTVMVMIAMVMIVMILVFRPVVLPSSLVRVGAAEPQHQGRINLPPFHGQDWRSRPQGRAQAVL
jgi:hypothetical protein